MVRVVNLFPPLLRLAIKALAYETRQLIVSYIILNSMARPKDLRKALAIESNDLAYHLNELVKGNIVRRRVRRREVIYVLTPLGQRLIFNLFHSIAPPKITRRREEGGADVDEYISAMQRVYREMLPSVSPSYEPEQYVYPLITHGGG